MWSIPKRGEGYSATKKWLKSQRFSTRRSEGVMWESYLRRRAPPTALARVLAVQAEASTVSTRRRLFGGCDGVPFAVEVLSTHNSHVWEPPSCLPLGVAEEPARGRFLMWCFGSDIGDI